MIKRYSVEETLYEDESGDFVTYDDYAAALSRAEKAESALCRAREIYDHYVGKEKWRTAFIDKLGEILYSSHAGKEGGDETRVR